MPANKTNRRSRSTTYEWRKVKISGGAPEGPSAKQPSRRWGSLRRRDPKSPLTITVTYRGGTESWWLVTARGKSAAFPGHQCLDDVFAEINQTFSRTRSD